MEGHQRGQLEMLLKLAPLKFGELPHWAISHLQACSLAEINRLSITIMDTESMEQWLKKA